MPTDATIQVPFTGGTDQRTAAEYVDPSQRLISVTNGVFTHEGAVDKRLGLQYLPTTQLSGDPTMGAPLRIVTRGNELAATDGDSLFSYSSGPALWAQRGLISPCVATRKHLSMTTSTNTGIGIAEGNGIIATWYRTTTGTNVAGDVYLSLYDSTSGAPLLSQYKATTGTTYYHPEILIVGTHLYLFYSDDSGNIYGNVLNLSTMAWSGASTIVSDGYVASNHYGVMFDATPEVGATGIMLTYPQVSSTASNVRYLRLEALPALTISASGTTTSSAGTTNINFLATRYDANQNAILFVWETFDGTNHLQHARVYNASWAQQGDRALGLTSTSVSIGPMSVEIVSSSRLVVAAESVWTFDASFNEVGTAPAITGINQYSRIFRATVNGQSRCYYVAATEAALTANGTQLGTYYLVDTRATDSTLVSPKQMRAVATLAPRQANTSWLGTEIFGDYRFVDVTNIGAPTAGTFRCLGMITPTEEFGPTNTVPNANAPTMQFVDLFTFDFSGATVCQTTEGATETFLSGGVPSFYDGSGVSELGFLQWPGGMTPTITTTGGELGQGTYGYAFCYAQVDNAGLIHRSPIYFLTATTSNTTSYCTFTLIPNLGLTSRYTTGRNPVVEVYRTAANGTTYYFAGSVPCVPNSPNSSLTFVDGQTNNDASIAANTLLPTTGGYLQSVNPPSFRCMARHVERLWGIDDTGFSIWFSTQFPAGFESGDAPYFNEALTLSFSEEPLTALASMDDKLVVFSATSIWYVVGQGPPPTGQGSDLTQAVRVPSDVGAIDWRSVVSTPLGVFFQAPMGGIYLLGRDLQVTYIGKQVQDYVGPNPTQTSASFNTVLAAALVPSSNHVRFVLTDGTVLFYDYVMQRWGLHGSFNGGATTATTGTVDAAGQWYMAGSDGLVYREKSPITDAAPWFDTTIAGRAWITTSVITAWVKLAGLQGYQRARHILALADWMEAADVEVWARFDYAPGSSYDQQQWFTYSALSAANAAQAQMDMHVKAMSTRSQAVQIELKDRAPTGGTATTGQGVRFLGLNFDCQVTGSRNRRLGSGVKA